MKMEVDVYVTMPGELFMFGWKKKEKPTDSATQVAVDEKKAVTELPRSDVSEPELVNGVLKVKVKERAGCSIVMDVGVPRERVAQEIENAYRRVQAKAKFPGFRPGKAPMELVKKNFEGSAWEDAVDHLLRETIYEALMQEKILGVGAPVVDKLKGGPGESLNFELKIECMPELKVNNYKNISLTKKVHPVTDADVEKRLKELQDSHAKLILSKDTVVEKKHFVVVDYESFLEGKPVQNGAATNQLIEMGATQNVEGFTEGLLGAKDGDVKEIPVRFPEEHPQKTLAGKTVTFKATVTALKEKEVPAIDDELAKDAGAKDLAEIKERFRSELQEGRRRAEREDLEKQIIESVLQRHVFAVPPTQVEERAKQLTEHLKKYLMERGAAVTDWEANEEKMREKNRPEAERQVRLSYILGNILETENIRVPEADVDAHIQKIIEGARPDQRTDVETWMKSRRDSIQSQMREERLFDFLISNATVTETVVDEKPS
ncbi:MAG: trigger factor [Elusimicrobia bacterium]|jgi:trigger factor|nr:trigger factor [Elusimicrobiota bacterium]